MSERTTGKPSTRAQALCARCMNSFECEDEAPKGASLLCPSCQRETEAAQGRPGGAVEGSRERATRGRDPAAETAQVSQNTPSKPKTLIEDVKDWCVGRAWWARFPLWAYLAYTVLRYWTSSSHHYRSIFDAINLGIHELGHYLFSYFGQFLHVAGGTIAQCMAPVLSGVMFLKQRDYFAIAVCVFWLGTNLAYVSVYMADARALQLPLVAPGMGVLPPGDGGVLHDWNHLFGITGLLRFDTAIAALVRVVAVAFTATGLAFGAWLMVRMRQTR